MKRFTVRVDDEVHRRVRARATELGRSASALVRRFLDELSGDTDCQRRKRAQVQAISSIRAFRAGNRLKRDELRERDTVR